MLPGLTLALLLATGAPAPEVLHFCMDTRGEPGSWVPALEYLREDSYRTPQVTREQLQTLQGLEVDFLRAIAGRMGARSEVVPTSWFALERSLLDKRCDLILGSWTPNPTTPADVVASIPYYDWGLLVAVRTDSHVHELSDLEGLRVGHIPDPSVAAPLRAMLASLKARFVEIKDGDSLFDQVVDGSLDAMLFDSMYVRWWVRHDPRLRIVGEPLNKLGYHVGVRASEPERLKRVNAAIQSLHDSGDLARIRQKWEGPTASSPAAPSGATAPSPRVP